MRGAALKLLLMSKNVGKLPVVRDLRRWVVVVGGSATNRAEATVSGDVCWMSVLRNGMWPWWQYVSGVQV